MRSFRTIILNRNGPDGTISVLVSTALDEDATLETKTMGIDVQLPNVGQDVEIVVNDDGTLSSTKEANGGRRRS